jgi:transcriptional regulator with XRE-family HTH domain
MPPVAKHNTPRISVLLKEARGDLSMRELARRSGLSAAQISRIESGDVERPSDETLVKLATALERDPRALLIAVRPIRTREGAAVVRQMLEGFPAGTSGDLAGGWHALNEQEAKVKALEAQGIGLDGEAAANLEVLDSWRVEMAEASHELEHFELRAKNLGDPNDVRDEYARRAAAAAERVTKASRNIAECKSDLDNVGLKLRRQQEELDIEEQRLEDMIRDYAQRLFLRQGPSGHGDVGTIFTTNYDVLIADALASEHDDPYGLDWEKFLSSHVPPSDRADEQHLERWRGAFDYLQRGMDELRDARARLLPYPDDRDFRGVARSWPRLTLERRRRVVEFVEDQRRLSVQEQLRDESREAVT